MFFSNIRKYQLPTRVGMEPACPRWGFRPTFKPSSRRMRWTCCSDCAHTLSSLFRFGRFTGQVTDIRSTEIQSKRAKLRGCVPRHVDTSNSKIFGAAVLNAVNSCLFGGNFEVNGPAIMNHGRNIDLIHISSIGTI